MRTSRSRNLADHPWRSLGIPKNPTEISARRMSEAIRWDFYWARDHEGRSLLVLRHDPAASPHDRLPRLKGVEVFLQPDAASGRQNLALRLLDPTLRDLFERLCVDIVDSTAMCASEIEAVGIALARTWRWHHLLRGGAGGLLSSDEQIGLIGELLVLERYLLPATSAQAALGAWRGPLGEAKDFVLGATAIESKAYGASKATSVHVSSEFQLDDTNTPSLFLHLSVFDSAEKEDDGFTLTDIALRVRNRVRAEGRHAREVFDGLMAAAGFRYEDDYSHARWQGGERAIFRVHDNFPRLTPANTPAGITNVRYVLSVAVCGAFIVDPAALQAALRGTHDV
jgi:hypothetical protein